MPAEPMDPDRHLPGDERIVRTYYYRDTPAHDIANLLDFWKGMYMDDPLMYHFYADDYEEKFAVEVLALWRTEEEDG